MNSSKTPHLLILCGTARGLLCLERIIAVAPAARLTVVSFREEPWEPPFFASIQECARRHGHRFIEAKKLERSEVRNVIADDPVDLLLAISWRYLVPADLIRKPQLGSYLLHDSLLPKYRGFSPTVWALINGETQTGATLLQMEEEVDSGGIVAQEAIPIGPAETIDSVMQRVTDCYLQLITGTLASLLKGTFQVTQQDHTCATFCCQRLPEDNRISWQWPADRILNLIRATTKPYPSAFTFLKGQRVRVWRASAAADVRRYVGYVPGRVVRRETGVGATVLTGSGPVFLEALQLDHAEIVTADNILTSLKLTFE